MKISITNFRRIKSAEIDGSKKITLIAGRNGEGKTSSLQAIAAALAGVVIPIDKLKKNESGCLINTGASFSQVSVETPIGSATVKYPENSRATEGAPVQVSDIAAGIRSFVDLDDAKRIQYITGLMKCEPRREDLVETLEKIGVSIEVIDRIWQTVQAQGWDGAHKAGKEQGSKLKGAWEEITGDRYGEKKAETWIPREWESDLQTATAETLNAAVASERQWLEAAIADAALGAAELERLRTAAEAVPKLQQEISDLTETRTTLAGNESAISKSLGLLPPATQPTTCDCPHCKKPVSIVAGKLIAPTILPAEELAERAQVIADTNAQLIRVREEITRINTDISQKQITLQAAQKAAEQLKNYKPAASTSGDHKGVEDCRTRVKRAEDRLAAWTKWQQAAAKHRGIVKNQAVIDALAPDGLRLRLLKNALSEINKQLAAIAATTGWETVEIEQDMSISYGDYQYMLHSQSKQYRIRISLQLALSILDGSQVVLVDGADILDGPGRNGLFKALHSFPGSAIVGVTISKKDDVPPIDKMNGIAYWVENGIAEKIRG